METAVRRKVNSQEKLNWSCEMLDDMVDIICSNEKFKIFLIFRNQKCATSTNIFEKFAEETNERPAADGRKNTITHPQIRNKFTKSVCERKLIRLSQRTVSGRHDPGVLKNRRNLKIKSAKCTTTAWLGIWEVMWAP